METSTRETWLKFFNDNYNEASPQAQELKDYVKDNYKGISYIPWAVMERMVFQQDPGAEFTIHENKNGGTVFMDEGTVETHEPTLNDGEWVTKYTSISWRNYFVKISCTYIGRTETEYYPIQDNKYSAPKIVDQNMVNKAIQRAKTKVASIVTGLGLKMYEGKDLQFEDATVEKPKTKEGKKKGKAEELKKSTVHKKDNKKDSKSHEKDSKEEEGTKDSPYLDYAKFIKKHKDKLMDIFKKMNVQVAKGYKFTFDIEKDTAEEISDKLDKVKNGKVFFKAILKQAGYSEEEIKGVL
jgi:hypothetical protein